MCGIAGFVSLGADPYTRAVAALRAMSSLIAHRGPGRRGRVDIG